jgi:hypothetical protein
VTRLWSRLGVRLVAVALLGAGVGAGYYLGEDREVQEQRIEQQYAFDADVTEMRLIKENHAANQMETVKREAAEAIARKKAAEAAKAAAERARRAEEASRKKREAEAREAQEQQQDNTPAEPYTGPIPESCDEFSGNREIGCALMLDRGFEISQFPCLNKLWDKESGWNHRAYNESSGAYGIPQALPGSKMATAGDDWRTNPATQIKWGLSYIKGRYGTPCDAWAHSQAVGWY